MSTNHQSIFIAKSAAIQESLCCSNWSTAETTFLSTFVDTFFFPVFSTYLYTFVYSVLEAD
jgi:hypothetical protein